MGEPIPNPADFAHLVELLEVETDAWALAVGNDHLPADLTRAPRPEELASRTSYAAMEKATLRAAADLGRLAVAARRSALGLVGAHLQGSTDVDHLISRLDDLAAAVTPLVGANGLMFDTQRQVYERLISQATNSLAQFNRDAVLAGIPVTGSTVLGASSLAALDAQAHRLASEAIAAAVRAARGSAYSTRRAQPVEAFHTQVLATAGEVGTLGLEDVAHQAALRATGAGRMDGTAQLPNQPQVTFYASELLDRNTCAPCSSIDGADLTRAQADDLYPGGQYVDCAGGGRCRGTVVAVWGEEPGPARPPDGLEDPGE